MSGPRYSTRAWRVLRRIGNPEIGVLPEASAFATACGVTLEECFPEPNAKGFKIEPKPKVRAHVARLLRSKGYSLERVGELLEMHHTTILKALEGDAPEVKSASEETHSLRKDNARLREECARLQRMLADIMRLASNA